MLSSIRNEKGVALIMAVFAMVLVVFIATEVAYETQVEYVSSSQAVARVKAYYAAKSGVELSLYRILIYKKAMAQFGEQLGENKSLLDPIWQFPFSWPPIGLDDLNEVDKDQAKTIVKESTMDAQYMVTIEGEGGKIDINDLGSENKALSDGVRRQILQIFENELENNKAFKEKYDNFDFDKLVNNIQDWVDEDKVSMNGGGDESSKYTQPDGAKNYTLPPNAAFKTVGELHMVLDMEDEFYDLLKDKITVFGTKGINVNYAPEPVLMALDPQIKDEALSWITKRRSTPELGGPFKDADDFYAFIETKGVRTENMRKAKLPLLFNSEYNFRIVSAGMYGNTRRELTVITYDVDSLTTPYVEMLDKLAEENKAGGTNPPPPPPPTNPPPVNPGTNPATKAKVKIPKGRPNIVFWRET
ncbi:MAG: general secretion pathway protein GspK [Bdellovibrionales bacterium]|nr:general secretion pathway protein GspK [Bdellovibrionales bacterium]